MAATINTRELNGVSPGTPTTVTAVYLQTIDKVTSDATNILMRPLAGNYYSFWKTLYLNAETSPVTEINNVRIYGPGSFWPADDVALYVGDETPVIGNYAQSTGTEGQSGNELVANHPAITTKTDFANYTSVSPKSVSGSISNPDTGQISDLVLFQAILGTSAEPGTLSSKTITWIYDEA